MRFNSTNIFLCTTCLLVATYCGCIAVQVRDLVDCSCYEASSLSVTYYNMHMYITLTLIVLVIIRMLRKMSY